MRYIWIIVLSLFSFHASSQQTDLSLKSEFVKLSKQAEAGDAKANYRLFSIFKYGYGTQKNSYKAISHLNSAVGLGDYDAFLLLSRLYYRGFQNRDTIYSGDWIITKNEAASAKIDKKMIATALKHQSEDAEANMYLALAYRNGIPEIVEADPILAIEHAAKAFKLAQSALGKKDIEGIKILAKIYESGLVSIPKNLEKALETYEVLSALGDIESELLIATAMIKTMSGQPLYRFFKNIKNSDDTEQGLIRLEALANKGHYFAQERLGSYYFYHCDDSKCLKKSEQWLLEAEKQRETDEHNTMLSKIYYEFDNMEKSFLHLLKAASISVHDNSYRQAHQIETLVFGYLNSYGSSEFDDDYEISIQTYIQSESSIKARLKNALLKLENELIEQKSAFEDEDEHREKSLWLLDKIT